MKLRVPLVTKKELCGCQLVLRTSKSAGARGDVQNFGGCQAPAAPVLTQALELKRKITICPIKLNENYMLFIKSFERCSSRPQM